MTKLLWAAMWLGLAPTVFAGVLYYGGDPGTTSLGLVSGNDGQPFDITHINNAWFYDDFVVPASGWTITGFGGHFATLSPSAVWLGWEIRSGMSDGVGGTLVTQGQAIPTVTPDGFDLGQTGYFLDFTLPITNYDIIELGPGTYWLGLYWNNVFFHGFTTPYARLTDGVNRVGGPFTNGSFWNAPAWGINFKNPAADLGVANADASYLIYGSSGISSAPEPGSWLLIGTGFGVIAVARLTARYTRVLHLKWDLPHSNRRRTNT